MAAFAMILTSYDFCVIRDAIRQIETWFKWFSLQTSRVVSWNRDTKTVCFIVLLNSWDSTTTRCLYLLYFKLVIIHELLFIFFGGNDDCEGDLGSSGVQILAADCRVFSLLLDQLRLWLKKYVPVIEICQKYQYKYQ